MRTQTLLLYFLLTSFLFDSILCAAPTIQQQCNTAFGKLGPCVNYASGKANSPSKECCTVVEDIKGKSPICLCYIIQQIHDGAPSLKQLGLKEAKLLQLPSDCKLANASLSECPALLNLSPSSPDYAIFTNASSPVTSAPSTTTTTPSPAKDNSSIGFMHRPNIVGFTTITVAITIFISLVPTGFLSVFNLGV